MEFSGTGRRLTLDHAAPVVATDVINFEMDGTGPGPVTLAQLTVATGLASVNINSIGTASDNVIADISPVADNINVTGGTHLTLGSDARRDRLSNSCRWRYRRCTDTGGVHVSLGDVGLNAGLVAQTFICGNRD